MTPQPQNLITDDELLQYSLLWAEAHSADTDGLGTVHTRAREFEKAIRSRPAPSAPTREIRGFVMIDRQKDFSMWLQDHDATIRNQTLDEVYDRTLQYEQEGIPGCNDKSCSAADDPYPCTKCIVDYVTKSLRTQSTEARQ